MVYLCCWNVQPFQRDVRQLVQAHFTDDELQCRLSTKHTFVVFSTVFIALKGPLRSTSRFKDLFTQLLHTGKVHHEKESPLQRNTYRVE
jgi:hypothetical protein